MSARRRRRPHQHEEHENHERWLVSYADFITLLFAFFTVLYATSQQDVGKEKEFEKSIRKSFAVSYGAGAAGSTTGEGASSPAQAPLQAGLAEELRASAPFPKDGTGPTETADYVERRARQDLNEAEYSGLIANVRHDSIGVRIQLAASMLFPPGSADLRPEALGALAKIGRMLKESSRRLIIEGHTDDEAIRTPRFPSNWELSASRATKIVRYLSLVQGIDGGRLTAVAYADKKPIAPNDTAEHRARNRRIEVLIVTAKQTEE